MDGSFQPRIRRILGIGINVLAWGGGIRMTSWIPPFSQGTRPCGDHRCSFVIPGDVREFNRIDLGSPAQQEFRLRVVQPGAVVRRRHLDARQPTGLGEVLCDGAVVERFVHADIEQLLRAAAGWSIAARIAATRSSTWTKFRCTARPSGSNMIGTLWLSRYPSTSSAGTSSDQRRPPKTSSPNERLNLKSSFSMIHGARRQQPFRSYCRSVLFQHHLLQHFRECIATRVGAVGLALGDGAGWG